MISISTQVANPAGAVVVHEDKDSTIGDLSARVSRVKTLDGGVVIAHSGVSDGDRTLQVRATITQEDETALLYMFKNFPFLRILTIHGAFLGALETCNVNKGRVNMRILIKGAI